MKITKNDITSLSAGEALMVECSYKEYYSIKNYAYQLARYDEVREKGISRYTVSFDSQIGVVRIKAVGLDA